MSGSVAYRAAKAEDAPVLSRLAFESKATHGYSEAFMEACREELSWRAEDFKRDDLHFLVAELESKILGFAAILVDADGSAELEALFVAPEATGSGVGRGLLVRIAAWARDNGLRSLTIQSDPDAVAFYARFGARNVGSSPSGSIPGRMLPELALDLNHPSLLGDV